MHDVKEKCLLKLIHPDSIAFRFRMVYSFHGYYTEKIKANAIALYVLLYANYL